MQKPHVLVVDDDKSIRSFLFKALDSSGYQVTAAEDGTEGVERFEHDRPDLVLTDLRMPGMDGRTFVSRLLQIDPRATIVVLTGHGSVETAVDLMRLGVYSVLTKPVKLDDILFMTEKAIRERRSRERNRELEHRLEISERLAMIGKLAAGVAHELNSPLDGVIRFVKLTLDTLPRGTEARDFQEEALSGLKRMSSIVKDLLTFSRNIALEVEEEALGHLLQEAARQVTNLPDKKEVEFTWDLAIPETTVPRGMFQVFQNLIKNAFDSVGEDGCIEIRCGVRDGEVFVSVRDNGCGIPPHIRDRVFEPFFTTKAVGRGTGLGLSIVNRIVERFGGAVSLESEEGEGTTVTVYLPTSASAGREQRDEQEQRTGITAAR